MVKRLFLSFHIFLLSGISIIAQQNSLVNTSGSPYAKLHPLNITDVTWTNGFWAERFSVCEHSMVPFMMGMYMNDSISHGFANFEIAAGLKQGEHVGPPFHDGDFYKMLEALIMVYSVNKDEKLDRQIDSIITIIGKTQRADGYIHTPVVIKQRNDTTKKKEFAERLDFETYNMGHLMTAACAHYRITGKKNLLNIAIKATDFLYYYYKNKAFDLAQNAICPSHYMGVIEMYRTTGNPKYLELAEGLINIRSMVVKGTDDNQDRIPFRQQREAVGHAVRSNYLYAGAADVFLETGEDSLMMALDAIWHDMTERKMYITGACGALYNGVSPDGTTYDQKPVQQVHQAFGRDYQLPNLTAHNESCANIGNLLWNWRMFLATGDAKYTDIMEQVMYNSLLAGVSLDGKGYFYTNPLAVSNNLPFVLRWSKVREPYIGYCNCCPPNTIRTVAEIQNYMYSLSSEGLWVNFFGGSKLKTSLPDKSFLEIEQITDYPWNGNIKINIISAPKDEFPIYVRIPGWASGVSISINGQKKKISNIPGKYTIISNIWKKGDIIQIDIPMSAQLIVSNPLVEETKNQVAIRRGPVVFCLESCDIPDNSDLNNIRIPENIELTPELNELNGSTWYSLIGKVYLVKHEDWGGQLYRELDKGYNQEIEVRFVPYYVWGNRGKGDMSVWLPLTR